MNERLFVIVYLLHKKTRGNDLYQNVYINLEKKNEKKKSKKHF